MVLDVALIGARVTGAFLSTLKSDGAQIKALAQVEGQKLATSLAAIAELLATGDIDPEEAEALIAVQKSATEAVFASLKGISQVTARHATRAALTAVIASVDDVIGVPLIGTVLGAVETARSGSVE